MISYAYKLLRNIQMNRLNYKVAILYFNLEQKYYTFENKLYKIDALRKLKLCLN